MAGSDNVATAAERNPRQLVRPVNEAWLDAQFEAVADRPAPVAPGAEYHLQIARTLDAMAALEQEWTALETRVADAAFFQSFAFSRLVAEHDAAHGESGFFVLAVRRGGDLVGLLPLRLQKKRWRTLISGLAEPFQQYTEMLLAPGQDADSVFALMRDAIAASGADYAYFGHVRADGPLWRALGAFGVRPTGEDKAAPFVPLGRWPDFETYFKTVNSKTRKNMRNARNRLARSGEITHQVAFDGPVLADVIGRTFEGRSEWLERMGLTSRAFRNAGFEDFLDGFKLARHPGVSTVAMRLMLGATPIAEQWGFVHRGRYYAYISTWDTQFEDYSPGRLHLEEVIHAGFEQGWDTADFLVPAVPYKLTFAPDTIAVADYVMPFTSIGRLYGNLFVRHLRPALKSLVSHMPVGLRKGLFGRLFGQRGD